MKFILTTHTKIPENWDSNLLKNSSSTSYQISSWGRIYQKSYNSIPLFLEIKNGGDIVAQLMVLIHKEYSWKNASFLADIVGKKLKMKNTLEWIYGPIIFDPTNQDEILQVLLNELDIIAENNNVNVIRGTTPPRLGMSIEKNFKKFGYNNTPWATRIINLGNDEQVLYTQLDKKTRYDIRKSEQNNIKFEVGSNFNAILDFNRIKNSKGKSKHADKLTKSRWENLYNTNNGKLFLAKIDDEPIGGISTLTFNKNLLQHGVANTKTGLLGGTFLTWNLIKWGIKHNFQTLDLGGINPNPVNEKERKISFYKSKWGGENFEYGIFTKVFDNTKFKLATVLQNPSRIRNFLKSD